MTDPLVPPAPEAAPPADPHLGLALGKYQLVERLGKGGMGVVYVAEDTFLQRRVAVKLLPESVTGAPEVLARFQTEARAAARLNHPNVVAIYDVGLQDGIAYLVMELVHGVSAQDLMQSRGALPCAEATGLIADVCRGLAAAHAAGLVHRDIKPANVMIPESGGAKLADFGLAKAIDASGASITGGAVLGTPHYMSPEQCRAERVDLRGDLYSLGATYYALLTGKPPYAGEAPLQLMFAHCSNPVPDPREVRAEVPERCARIVLRAMAKEPPDRFGSAEEMLAELEDAGGAKTETREEAARPPTSQVFDSTRSAPGASPAREPQPLTREDLLGEAALRNNFVTREQLDECLAARRETGTSADLATILLAKGFVTEGQVEKLRRAVEVAWRRLHPEEVGSGPLPSEVSLDPLIGKVLAGEFRVERLIGRGGMGSVYLAEQLSLARRVAVKVLPLGPLAPDEALERFRREAKAAARLQHPNIVQVFFSGEEAGQHFIVMEYVEGIAVGDRLGRGRKIPADEAVAIGASVARGLAAAHQQGIIHRDLKPDNIFLALDGAVKLGDFGLARDLSGNRDVSISGTVLGTPLYMAPEQCQAKKVDGRADLYSLGATLFHLVTGRPPNLGGSLLEIMNRQVSAAVPSACAVAPEVPAGLDALIRRLMQKDPTQRPQTAGETAALLDTVLTDPVPDSASEPVRASPAFEMPTRAGLLPASPDATRFAAVRRAAALAGVFAISVGIGLAALSSGGSKTPVKAPEPVVEKLPDPAPVNSARAPEDQVGAQELTAARNALAANDLAAAFAILNSLSPKARYGSLGDSLNHIREKAVQAAASRWGSDEATMAKQLEARDFSAVDHALTEWSALGVAELDARIARGREKLKQARAAAEKADEAERARLAEEMRARAEAARLAEQQAEAAWLRLAPQAWAAAGKGEWGAAIDLCDKGISGRGDLLAALRRVLGLGRKADEAIGVALGRMVHAPVSFDLANGGRMEGTLESANDGHLKFTSEGNKAVLEIEAAELSGAERIGLAERGIKGDRAEADALAVYALAVGDWPRADAALAEAAKRKAAFVDDLAVAAQGWDAPWSAEAIALRAKRAEASGKTPAEKPEPAKVPPGKSPAAGADDLVKWNDEFNDPGSLKNWTCLGDEEKRSFKLFEFADIARKNKGRLTLVPAVSCWYERFRGDLLYKMVEGDFVATTAVRVHSKSSDRLPAAAFSLAGLMVRFPRMRSDDYLLNLYGVGEDRRTPGFEIKRTQDFKSFKVVDAAETPEALLRIVRIGTHFLCLTRTATGKWKYAWHAEAKEAPKAVQVGITAYTDWDTCSRLGPEEFNAHGAGKNGNPDLKAEFDYVRLHRPRLPDSVRAGLATISPESAARIFGEEDDGQ